MLSSFPLNHHGVPGDFEKIYDILLIKVKSWTSAKLFKKKLFKPVNLKRLHQFLLCLEPPLLHGSSSKSSTLSDAIVNYNGKKFINYELDNKPNLLKMNI